MSTDCRWTLQQKNTAEFVLTLSGTWRLESKLPAPADVLQKASATAKPATLAFDTRELESWDSGLLMFLNRLLKEAEAKNLEIDRAGLPEGVQRLLKLAGAVPEKKVRSEAGSQGVVTRIGTTTLAVLAGFKNGLAFIGEAVLAFGNLLRGKARFRTCDFTLTLQECGASALPIVSLISFLVGFILAFVAAVQLEKFGAQIYVADLVGIAVVREMGAVMAAIIMAGRTGAAFAAQLGTMTVNEEIDALKTMAVSPMEFLVLPRMLALGLMMPLLCLYADLIGIVGGAAVGTTMLDITATQYWEQTRNALTFTHCAVGLTKSSVFGILIAVAGCWRGMQSGRSASAVGEAATSAVVTAIVWIIVTDAAFAVLTDILDV